MKYAVKITVLKKLFHEDIIQEYAPSPSDWTPCDKFDVGDTFLLPVDTPWDKPADFCGWAWADIQKMAWGMSRGGPDRFVTSCTDGYRPVIFLLERIEAL